MVKGDMVKEMHDFKTQKTRVEELVTQHGQIIFTKTPLRAQSYRLHLGAKPTRANCDFNGCEKDH